jgi:hypothetical protein
MTEGAAAKLVAYVGDTLIVRWSNGHGYSLYRIAETEDDGHVLFLIEDVETVFASDEAGTLGRSVS